MDYATAQAVREVAVEFGFKAGFVTPIVSARDPWKFCQFEVLGVTYQVNTTRLSILNQTR